MKKITAEAPNGSFCLLPRHVDFLAALEPGLLLFETEDGREQTIAVDEGILVKCGDEVRVSVWRGIRGEDTGSLNETIEREFRTQDEREQRTRTAMAQLQADFVRRFLEREEHA